jgi:hypothetical protein
MWTYLIGPILAFLPRPWRESLPFAGNVQWGRATALSGLVEWLSALAALGYWYKNAMTLWVDHGITNALAGKFGPGVKPEEIGGVALTVWWMHPLTWLLAYFLLEGTVRFGAAAFGEERLGILPLAFLDWIIFRRFRRRNPASVMEAGSAAGSARSLVEAVRERVLTSGESEKQDELRFRKEGGEELLEIRASRRKQDWIPPRVVRIDDAYYRLEDSAVKTGPRPFLYTLRRLPAGVPGRSVLLYSPPDVLVRE